MTRSTAVCTLLCALAAICIGSLWLYRVRREHAIDVERGGVIRCQARLKTVFLRVLDQFQDPDTAPPSSVEVALKNIRETAGPDSLQCPVTGSAYCVYPDADYWRDLDGYGAETAVVCSVSHSRKAGEQVFLGFTFDGNEVQLTKLPTWADMPVKSGTSGDDP